MQFCAIILRRPLLTRYPLEKAFFFISTKPAMVEYDRVASVEFNRVEQSGTANASRSFDLTCALKDGGATQFVNLARSEYKKLYDYLVTRKVSAILCAILPQFCAILRNYSDAPPPSSRRSASRTSRRRARRRTPRTAATTTTTRT